MGQASVLKFLQRYKKSEKYKKKKWLTAREIFNRMKKTKDGSAIGSVTTSIKKLRDSEMISYKEMPSKRTSRMILHYRVK